MKIILIIFLVLFLISCANDFHSAEHYYHESSSSITYDDNYDDNYDNSYDGFNFKFGNNLAMVQNDILLSSYYDGYYNISQFLPSDNEDSKDDFLSFLTRPQKPSIFLSKIDDTIIATVTYPFSNEILFFAKNNETQLFEKLGTNVVQIEHDKNNANVQPGSLFGSSITFIKYEGNILLAVGSPKGKIQLDNGEQITSGFISIYKLETGADNEPSVLKYYEDFPWGNPISIKNFYNENTNPEKIQENILFGKSMVANENCLIVGAPNFKEKDAPNQKAGRVFTKSLVDDTQPIRSWQTRIGFKGDPQIGWSLALQDNKLVMGLPGSVNKDGVTTGMVDYVELNDDCSFIIEQAKGIRPHLNNDGDRFGHSVGLSDFGLVIGAPGFDNNNESIDSNDGTIYYYKQENDKWKLQAFSPEEPIKYNILYSDLFK